jgi:hypothetical protein
MGLGDTTSADIQTLVEIFWKCTSGLSVSLIKLFLVKIFRISGLKYAGLKNTALIMWIKISEVWDWGSM